MDRLVCGDVGFGKTEVALRAIFRCVSAGKQAVLLAPTIVLAAQHYRTLQLRFATLGVEPAMLSRFASSKEKKEVVRAPLVSAQLRVWYRMRRRRCVSVRCGRLTKGRQPQIARLNAGEQLLVVGTHALLSDKISLPNLGLLVVDEEQRFGVTHKEKLKSLSLSTDILTLSATPIPRTLQLAMSGLRNLTTIETPPPSRKGVDTAVIPESDDAVRTALTRELARGGQVRVASARVALRPAPCAPRPAPRAPRPA